MKKIFHFNRLAVTGMLSLLILLGTGCQKFLDTQRQGGYDADQLPGQSG